MKNPFLISLLFFLLHIAHAQSGCTDPKANNYNASATINDGSCTYNGANISPLTSKNLSALLTETSGLIHWNNNIWSHNDDTDNKLYALDTATAAILQSYTLTNTVNKDWEEISQDSNYVYVGDFGNNSSGNRTDLHILRVEKNSLLLNTPVIDTIWFSYSNQTDFTPKSSNSTDFDCEAFVVSSDSIYLFTKQWISNKTSIYAMPKTPGTYVAALRSTINIGGLATGITYLKSKRLAVICGYSNLLQPFFYLLYDFRNNDFAFGNKRKISVNLPFHQMEGIATANGLKYYASNESQAGNAQQLHTFDLSSFLSGYLKDIVTNTSVHKSQNEFSIFPNPAHEFVTIRLNNDLLGSTCMITDATGKNVMSIKLNDLQTIINTKAFPVGLYIIHIEGKEGSASFIKN
ncbi:MAG: hypothetical protein JWN78_492 [Bacteroidota bacterium]|nr:hypothetical protein [Bacteroidota bacterium]